MANEIRKIADEIDKIKEELTTIQSNIDSLEVDINNTLDTKKKTEKSKPIITLSFATKLNLVSNILQNLIICQQVGDSPLV